MAFSLVAQLSLSGCAWSPIRYGAHINILHLNDVYDVTPNEDGAGGLARVKTLVDEARRKDPSTLLIISGDFLSPSLLSSLDKGSSVIEILNLLQVDYVTFGNHDFDFGMDILKKRIKQSKFKWISSNILELGGRIPGT
ncbi:MAG: metallophosphoesterase, partial [Nitrospinota bacterium]|nr:metallophosphoesterase [Nitrospinota bacterium]